MQNSPKNTNSTPPSDQDHQNGNNAVDGVPKKAEISEKEYEEMRKRAHEIAQGILHGPDAVESTEENSEALSEAPHEEMPEAKVAAPTIPSDTEMSPAEVEKQIKSIHHDQPAVSSPEPHSFGIVDTINTMILEKQENIRRRDEENAIDRADMQGLQILKNQLGNPHPDTVIHLSRALAALAQPEQKAS